METASALITFGALLLLGLLTDMLGRRINLPRVTLMLLFGVLLGPSALHLLSPRTGHYYPVVADMTLVMIGFLLGGKFTIKSLRQYGRQVLGISLGEVIGTVCVVFFCLFAAGVSAEIALILAAIATATDPAATMDVINETRAKGPCTEILTGVVAVDDAWGLIAFSVLFTLAEIAAGNGHGLSSLYSGIWEIGGAVLLGVGLGIPMAHLTGRIRPGEPTLVEALGIVFLCGGLAQWLQVSFLLAAMVLGIVVVNLATHHTRPFHAIEHIEQPFMILFFVLAGASLRLGTLLDVGILGTAYLVLRVGGRLIGAWLGGYLSGASGKVARWMGFALLPQAGVALGMALVASQRLPELREYIMPVIIGSTVFFELAGPFGTRLALDKWQETGRRGASLS